MWNNAICLQSVYMCENLPIVMYFIAGNAWLVFLHLQEAKSYWKINAVILV